MLLILADRVLAPCRINTIVSAEFPDPVAQPELHAAVQQFMVHGPCDTRSHLNCRSQSVDGECTRRFPKPLMETTRILHDGFPEYRRRGRFCGRDGDRVVTDDGLFLIIPICWHDIAAILIARSLATFAVASTFTSQLLSCTV